MTSIVGDKYAPGFVIEGFAQHGVIYTPSLNDASTQFLEALPLINSGRAVLLDHPGLLGELRGLERRGGPSGRDKVGHRPGAHDDLAVAACAVLVRAARKPATVDLAQFSAAFGRCSDDLRAPSAAYLPGEDADTWSAYKASRFE